MEESPSQSEKPKDFNEWIEEDLKKQYIEIARILNSTGVLSILSDNKLGIVGINGQEYSFPSFETIKEDLLKNQEIIDRKRKQGFIKLEIIPFALPLSVLIEKLKTQLIKHSREGKLFRAKKYEISTPQPFDIDEDNPISVESSFDKPDEKETIVYDPREFSEDHQGKTKKEMLEILDKTSTPGYLITLIETGFLIKNKSATQTIEGREQLTTNKTPSEYLDILKHNPAYQEESGQTPEEWIIHFLTNLKRTNETIDDQLLQIGAFFPSKLSGGFTVPLGRIGLFGKKLLLRLYKHIGEKGKEYGTHTSIRVNTL